MVGMTPHHRHLALGDEQLTEHLFESEQLLPPATS
jgi:hypothetical protein